MTTSLLMMLFILSFAISFCLAPLVVKFSNKVKLTDNINKRSAHEIPTPRGGGLIFIISYAAVLVLNALYPFFNISHQLSVILMLSFACALLGLLDDKYSLPSWLRFVAQFLLVLYPALHLPVVFPQINSGLQHSLYIISWMWFINLFNFMDGTDGYAAQESVFILFLLAIFSTSIRPIAAIIIAACLGFLRVNYPKAKIFMGDAGSYFLGYLLFGLMLYLMCHTPTLFLPIIIISALFTVDATFTLVKRILQKQAFWKAHRSHWYQRLYNIGYSHRFIFWFGVFVNTLLLLVSLCIFYYQNNYINTACVFFAVFILFASACFIKSKERLYLKGDYEKSS